MSEMDLIANNKKAYHEYFISDELECGIALEGSEVKSIRQGGISINESFIQISKGEMFLKNAYIKPYKQAASYIPDSKRNRKLLLHRQEINKYDRKIKEKGWTIVPLKVYIKNGLVKILIGLGKGKKLYDKKQVLIEKTQKRQVEIAIKTKNYD